MSDREAAFTDDDFRFKQLMNEAAYFADSNESKKTAEDVPARRSRSTSSSGANIEAVIRQYVRKIISTRGFPAQIYSDDRTLATWTTELYEDVTQDVVLDLINREQFAYIAEHAVHIGGLLNILKKQTARSLFNIQRETIEGNLSKRSIEILEVQPFGMTGKIDGVDYYDFRNSSRLRCHLEKPEINRAVNVVRSFPREIVQQKETTRLPRFFKDETLQKILHQILTILGAPITRQFLDKVFRRAFDDYVITTVDIDLVFNENELNSDNFDHDSKFLNSDERTQLSSNDMNTSIDEPTRELELDAKAGELELIIADSIVDALTPVPNQYVVPILLGLSQGRRQNVIARELGIAPARVTQLLQAVGEITRKKLEKLSDDLDEESLSMLGNNQAQSVIMDLVVQKMMNFKRA
jgi:hypothetical protein